MKRTRKNKEFNPLNYGVTHFLNIVGGKWKVLVLYGISKNCNRFSLLQKIIPQISKQMLINQLRELEDDNIIERTVFAEIPPRVEYKVSRYGKSILPIIITIQKWGLNDMKRTSP